MIKDVEGSKCIRNKKRDGV